MKVKIRGKIFGSLRPGEIAINIGYNYGMIDGGGLRTILTSDIPKECRFPNTHVWLSLENGNVIKVEKMSLIEINENS